VEARVVSIPPGYSELPVITLPSISQFLHASSNGRARIDNKNSGVSLNPDEASIKKYKQMLMARVKDALEIMGYGSAEKIESEIFGIVRKPKKRRKKAAYSSNLKT
jgi:hypothetical protein